MRKLAIVLVASLALAACGTNRGDRGLSGAGIGAGIGILGGPPGMVVGGAIGATLGMATQPNQLNLGRPAWQ